MKIRTGYANVLFAITLATKMLFPVINQQNFNRNSLQPIGNYIPIAIAQTGDQYAV